VPLHRRRRGPPAPSAEPPRPEAADPGRGRPDPAAGGPGSAASPRTSSWPRGALRSAAPERRSQQERDPAAAVLGAHVLGARPAPPAGAGREARGGGGAHQRGRLGRRPCRPRRGRPERRAFEVVLTVQGLVQTLPMFSVVEEHAGEMVSHMVGTIEGHMVSWMKLFKFLLMLGALAATVTYEAAMSPPCGLWDYGQSGHWSHSRRSDLSTLVQGCLLLQ
jgi:hypothetical protein